VSERPGLDEAAENDHRNLVNLLAFVAILLLAIGGAWVLMQMDQSRKIEACLEARRPDCAKLAQ